MPAVLGIDLGKQLGFGLVGRGRPISGSHEICKKWAPLGENLLKLEARLHSLIVQHRPDVLATAIQFVNLRQASTFNLVPIFGGFAVLNMLAAAIGLPLEFTFEGAARRAFLGTGMVPKTSPKIKAAVIRACQQRGWPATDEHAADALCVASWAHGRLVPGRSYETTPLFQAAPTMRLRRQRAA